MNTEKRKRIESFEYLNERFEYNPNSGQLFWKVLFPGREAGTPIARGYLKVALERLDFKAHRLCWILYYKEVPTMPIDHIDGNTANNKITNLRLCTTKENCRNSTTPKNNTTGFKGVSRCGKKFRAYITVNRKQLHLGLFEKAEEAFAAYYNAAKIHFGKFRSVG